MTESDNIKKYLTAKLNSGEYCRADVLSIKKIEQLAGIPTKNLHDFLKNKKYVHIEKHLDKIVPVLVNFGYKPLNSDNQFL